MADIPVVLLLDFGCDRFIKSVCKTFAFRIMNKEVFNKLWNSIYNEILYFISMHWISAAILESRNFSLNLSDSLCQLIETTGCFQIYVKLELFLLWLLTAASSFGVVEAIERLLCYRFDYNQVLFDLSTHSRFSDISLIFHAAWLFLYRFVLLKNPADILYKTLYNYRCWPQSTNFSHSSATLV